MDLYYKWNLEAFKKVFSENSLKSTFIEVGNNCVVVLVNNFEEMKDLFGKGRSKWAIAMEKDYWEDYVSKKGGKQFVYVDFNKNENSPNNMFAFTYNPLSHRFTDAANTENREVVVGTDKTVRYILECILDVNIKNILKQ